MSTSEKAQTAAGLIRATGAKVTRGRVRVLEFLRVSNRPLSHAELEAALSAEDGSSIDRVTLYRVLDSLVFNDLVLKAVDTHGVFRYSYAAAQRGHSSHIHFHCADCGGMFCLDAKPPMPPKLPRGFQLASIEFDIRGTCKACASNAASA
jgi:Fur family ferric uptake transcriptional regulator